MATVAMQTRPGRIRIDRDSRKVQELTELIVDYSPRFHRIARTRLGNTADAEDAVQDAILSALTHVEQFRHQSKMSTWLTSIVINSARMKLRRRLTSAHLVLDESIGDREFTLAEMVPDKGPGPEETCCRLEVARILALSASQLPPSLLRTFQLRKIQGLSIQETAHLLGVPAGTVKARTTRAHRKLKSLMQAVVRPKSTKPKRSPS
jgi:RNA polymerase sigma-70 factor (ECF subfamily)